MRPWAEFYGKKAIQNYEYLLFRLLRHGELRLIAFVRKSGSLTAYKDRATIISLPLQFKYC